MNHDKDSSNNFLDSELYGLINLLREDGETERADYLKRTLDLREKINNEALEIIDWKSSSVCGCLAANIAEKNPEIAAVFEIGWAVDGFLGIARLCNRFSKSAAGAQEYQTAVMFRVFSIAACRTGIDHVGNDAVDKLLSSMYGQELEMPSQTDWDEASAKLAFDEAELEIDWQDSQKEQNGNA